MHGRPRHLVVLSLSLLLAGCATLGLGSDPRDGDDGDDGHAKAAATLRADDDGPVILPVAYAPAARAAPPQPNATLHLQELWLRPVQDQSATLDAPDARAVAWYVGIDGIHPDARFINGRPYVTAEPGKASAHPATTGPIDPGAGYALRFPLAGRHLFVVEGAATPLAVSVRPDAPDEDDDLATTFLVIENGEPRFLPDRVAIRPHSRVLFVNQANVSLEAVRVAFQPWVAGSSARLDFTPVDEGLYTLVAEVQDATGANGEARARFLVDFDRPSDHVDVGPLRGRFTGLPTIPEGSHTWPLQADHPIAHLALHANATSDVDDNAAAIRLQLEREGATIAEFLAGPDGGHLEAHDLPPGRYTLRILHEAGALVDYNAEGRATLRLPVPERLREGT